MGEAGVEFGTFLSSEDHGPGPDPEAHATSIRTYIDAGDDEVDIHQIGPDQEGFFRFFRNEVEPWLRS